MSQALHDFPSLPIANILKIILPLLKGRDGRDGRDGKTGRDGQRVRAFLAFQHTALDMKREVAEEARSDELVMTILYPTSVSGMAVLFNSMSNMLPLVDYIY